MNTPGINKEQAALAILKSTGADILEAALVAKRALEAGHGKIGRAMKCVAAGENTLKQQTRTVSFEKAAESALETRQGRRIRTIYDFRYFSRRFMKRCPGLAKRRVRSITAQECAQYIEMAFATPRQQQKARLILSGIFSTAVKRSWCDTNPVAKVEAPRVEETRVPILSVGEIAKLLSTAQQHHNGQCAAAVGLMLYAGIRPHEVSRLTWNEVDLQERAIYILPRHSKTGGARRITIHKPLMRILQKRKQQESSFICPPSWLKNWRELRRAAGWNGDKKWPQDTLRHTYASYHLSYFRSYAELQCEIGHRDTTLLRTRYVDQRAVQAAARFWE